MMMKTLKLAAAALLASTCAIPAAMAINFAGDYTITANSSDPGLVVHTSKSQPNLDFNLNNVGDSTTFNLFKIWTDETTVNPDDTVAKPISVAFSFTSPELFGGSVDGSTVGQSVLFGFYQAGKLTWDNGGDATFNFWGGGRLGVHLTDVTFNEGLFGLHEGKKHGGIVDATFTLSAVPEPATWLTMIAGFGMIGAAMRRRRAVVAVAA